jgi:hypothetical protein
VWWKFVKLTKHSAVTSKKRAKKSYFKEPNTYFLLWKTVWLVFFRVCAHRTETYKCVFPEYYFWEHFAPKLIFLLIFQLNCLKFLLSYLIVFGTYYHIRNLIHYILLCKLFYRCANLQFLNVKLKFFKPWMKHKLVCEVCCGNMLQTCWFKNDTISVRIGNVT